MTHPIDKTYLLPRLQIFTGWQFDMGSFVLGLLLGLLLAYGFYRFLPRLRQLYNRGRGWVRQRLSWLRSGVEVRYLAEAADFVQNLHVTHPWATLDELFVPPRLTALPEDVALLDDTRGATQLHALWPELAAGVATPLPPSVNPRQLLQNGRRVIIAARPGAGKSTLLAHCAYRTAVAAADGPDAFLAGKMPVFVHLAEMALAYGDDELAQSVGQDAASLLAMALQKRSSALTGPGVKDLLLRKLKAGQVLLLIDGWDELPPAKRPFATTWLGQLLNAYAQTQVFLAADLDGYGPLLALGFTRTTIVPWRVGEVETYAARCTKAFPLSQPPRLRYYWQPGQTALNTTLNFLRQAFLDDGNKQPQRLPDILPTVLTLFKQQKGKSDNKPVPEEIAFWQVCAYTLLQEQTIGLSEAELAALAEAQCQNEAGEVDKSRANRLQKSLRQSGLIITWRNGRFSFRSPVWRDYLAACHLAAQRDSAEASAYLEDGCWDQTLYFYVAQVGAGELAAKLLQVKSSSPARDEVFRLASWMSITRDKGEWRRQTMILLGQIIRQSSFANVLRQRAMAALVQTGEPGVLTFVSQLLERTDPFLRQLGTTALPALIPEKGIELMAKMLTDGDPRVRYTAVYGLLLWQHHPLTERPLVTALISDDEDLNRVTAVGLAFNGAKGIEILKEAAEDEDLQVRRAAVLGLSQLDEDWVEPFLVKIERYDNEWYVRSAANAALETLRQRRKPSPWLPVQPVQQRWLTEYANQERRTVPEGAAAMPFLVQILSEAPQPKMRASAALLLGHLPAKDAIPALETAVRDSEPIVSEAAFTTLCQLRRAYDH